MVACSHAGFAQTNPLLENNGSLTKLQKWDLDNLSTEIRAPRMLTGSRQNAEKVGRLRFAINDCLLLRRTQSAPQGEKRVCIAKPILRDTLFA